MRQILQLIPKANVVSKELNKRKGIEMESAAKWNEDTSDWRNKLFKAFLASKSNFDNLNLRYRRNTPKIYSILKAKNAKADWTAAETK